MLKPAGYFTGYSGKWHDRTELNDLADKWPDKRQQMGQAYQQWATRIGAVDWDDFKKKRK